ncbi:MarR family transcriptional regulator [Bailinhaonella thermotolerans]|uniref:MarR family transcriptional regulator n=2 Tax=Bailinhaonella thermotolerans TaxID=1070861 RepID=A0A3A4A3F5_9ACTN|nr:MarR family transcriptional regulator [Bailinhaonella thermotolerans]
MVKQVELAIRARIDEIVRASDITVLQYTALTVLLRHEEPVSSAQLARNSFVTAQSMADMVAALERRGLIERHTDPRHRRRLLIRLTPSGRDLIERHEAEISALEARMVAGLTPAQVESFRQALNACRRALTE